MNYEAEIPESSRTQKITLEFGTENIELSYSNEVSENDTSDAHQYHKECLHRIRRKNVCEGCGKETTKEDIVMAKGEKTPEHEPFTQEEFEKYKYKKKLELVGITKIENIPTEFITTTLTAFPTNDKQLKTYYKLQQLTLNKQLVTKIVLRNRERNAVITKHPTYPSLMRITILRYPTEVKKYDKTNENITTALKDIKITPFEQLQIQQMTNLEYSPEENTLQDNQQKLIQEFLLSKQFQKIQNPEQQKNKLNELFSEIQAEVK